MSVEKHKLPELPYGYSDLEPYIDEETMRLHHDKHHAAYVNNLNIALEKYPELLEKDAEELIKNLNNIPEDIRVVVRNNGGGHVNHSMFWQIMKPIRNALSSDVGGPNGGGPSGDLGKEINKRFGSFNQFKEKFNDAGLKRFGSGWVWLVKNKKGELEVVSTQNQDNPITDGYFPLIGNDVWEHAYYLKYKNMRTGYLKAWWNVVNWEEAEKRFKNAQL